MFFNMDKKTIYTALVIFAVISLLSMGAEGILTTALTLPGVILAITFHEYAHAFVADKFGDTTPRYQGRLSFDPGKHIDPFGLFLLIFAHIGWGKPVETNPNNYNSNKSKETCQMWVSLAGPITNFVLAIIFTIIYYLMIVFIKSQGTVIVALSKMVLYAIWVNIGLGVFNLIPIPPLDGEKIFRRFLPYKAIEWLDRNEQMLYMVFMLLWITGLLGTLVSPIIEVVFNGIFRLVGFILGIFIG